MSTEQTFSVDIPDAELPAGATAPVIKEAKPKVTKPAEVKPDPRDDELRQSREALAQAHAERERLAKELTTTRQAATGRVNDLERENHKRTGQALYAHGQSTYAEHQQIIGAIHSTKMETASAKKELEDALNDDNLDARERARRIADAQERIALAAADSRTLEHGRTTLEEKLKEAQRNMEAHMKTRPRGEPDPEPEPKEDTSRAPLRDPEPAVDPFEKYVGQFPADSQKWLRDHPEYVKDPKLNKRLQAAALEWDADGKPLHTSEFIEELNKKFFKKEEAPVIEEEDDGETEEVEAAPAAPVKAKSTPAAPVSRSAKPTLGSNQKTTRVQLTNDERQAALDTMGPGTRKNLSPEDAMKLYAINQRRMIAEGRMDKR